MTPTQILEILEQLGVYKIKKRVSHDGYLHCSCFMAPYSDAHQSQVDRKPSMWISTNGRSYVGCWTCGVKGKLLDVLNHLNEAADGRYNKIVAYARDLEGEPQAQPRRRAYIPPDYTAAYAERERFPYGYPVEFLTSKGVQQQQTYRAFRLGLDAKKGLILFPIINRIGMVHGAQARLITPNPNATAKYFSYYEKTEKSRHLFAEHLLDLVYEKALSGRSFWTFRGKGIVVVEGPLDCMHAYDVGVRNVVSIMGSKLSTTQALLLREFAKDKPILFLLDPDAAGRNGALQAINQVFLDCEAYDADVRMCFAPRDPKVMTAEEYRQTLQGATWHKQTTKSLLRQLARAGLKSPSLT